MTIHPSARGGKDAKAYAAQERRDMALISGGVLSDHSDVHERAISEAKVCRLCGEFVHPSNWTAHLDMYHSEAPLSDDECHELEKHEAVIESGLQTFYSVGTALLAIRDNRLYRQGFKTFEAYFQSRWQLQKSHVYRLMEAANVMANLSPIGEVLPANEAQVRPLTQLNPEQQQAAWQRVIETVQDGKPTAAIVKTIVEEMTGKKTIGASVVAGSIENAVTALDKVLEGASEAIKDFIVRHNIPVAEKVEILKRLEKSAQKSQDSNQTFHEILATGGFAYGKDTDAWCDFVKDSIQTIQRALDELAKFHRQQARDDKYLSLLNTAETTVPADENHGILTGDASQLFDVLADNSVDLFFTDPPYHEDSTSTYDTLARLAAAKLKPGGLCLAYSGQMHLPEVMQLMSRHLCYWWMFAIEMSGGHLQIWNRQLWNDWKPVLVYAKPLQDGKLAVAPDWTMDMVRGGGRDKRFHEWGQDAGEATYWIERLTQPAALVCDPFVGGAAIPTACKLVGRRWIGTEKDTAQAKIARLRVMEANPHDTAAD